jgi:hypothetical protein
MPSRYARYLSWVSYAAHSLGLGVGIVNGADLMADKAFTDKFDFAVDTFCFAGGYYNLYSFFQDGEQVASNCVQLGSW